jgi:hypothetical protein
MPLVSLGAQCYPAWLIRRMGLRDAAYPFDWLWSDPMMVVACIEDGFATFLDRRQHETFGGKGHQSTHLVYGPKFDRRIVFNHHDITNDGIYDQYVRAVERLQALLGAPDPDKRFVVFGPPDRMTDAAFQALARSLQASGPGNSLVAVSLHAARKQRETRERAALPNARLFDVFPQSEMQHGLSFADEADNLALESLFMNVT